MTIEKIGRYKILKELGRGGMSTVYLGHDPNVDRRVAVKLLPREFLHHPSFRERFNREARIIAALEHPSIVPIYDFGEEQGQPYFVMRFMSGGSLVDQLKGGPLTIEEAANIIERIGSALQTAHARGIVHRDLKPGNILFDQFGKAYLGDFGIARLQETGANLTGTIYLGTPAYMSPEQVQSTSEVDGRADIYALGVILFEVLTGKKPYSANTAAGLALKHLTEPVPSILESKPDLPHDVQRVISKAMAKDREQRYPSAMDMTNAVVDLTGEQTMIAAVLPPMPDAPVSDPMATMIAPSSISPPTSAVPAADQPSTFPGAQADPAYTPAVPVEPTEPAEKRRRPWLLPLIGIVAVLAIIATLVAVFVLPGDDKAGGAVDAATKTPRPEPTNTTLPSPTTMPTAVPEDTSTPTPLPTRRPTNTPLPPTPTEVPTQAAEEPTLRPTNTATPTSLPSPTRPPATATSPPPPPTSPPPPTAPPPTAPPSQPTAPSP